MRLEKAVGRLATLVERRLGLSASSDVKEALATHLEGLASRRHWGTYLERLESALPGDAELRALAERLTVGETYFFRHQAQLEVLVEQVLPRVQQEGRTARVLSAGCSTGEEAYSLAILGRESSRVDTGRLFIVGVDLNPRAIERARRAHYAPWALRDTPDSLRERWFHALPDHGAALRPEVRDAVLFEERNLLDEDPAFWAPGSFDVILCRNVLIYFSAETARRAVARLEQALTPGGFLFLGPSENLRGLSEAFEAVQAGDAFYFQRGRVPRPSPRESAMTPQPTPTPRALRRGLRPPRPDAGLPAGAVGLRGGRMKTRADLSKRLAELKAEFDASFSRPTARADVRWEVLLRLRVGAAALAVPLEQLTGLHALPRVVPLPDSPPGLLGVTGLRGQLVAVHDLATCLGLPSDEQPRWLLLCGTGHRVGLAVGGFEGQLRVAPEQLQPDVGAAPRPYLSTTALRPGEPPLPVLDVVPLVKDLLDGAQAPRTER